MVLALLTLAMLALGYFGVGLFVATRLTAAPDRQSVEQTPAEVGLDYREVSFQSPDGLKLAGWWVPGDDASGAVVLVPGLEGDKSDTHILQTAPLYAGAGYSVLMIDLRAQGDSEGQRITMGYQEVWGVRGALAWLEEGGFKHSEVIVHGWSMGAATVLQAAPGTGVAAVVADSAYADLPQILRERLPEASSLPPFFNPGIMLAAKLLLGLQRLAEGSILQQAGLQVSGFRLQGLLRAVSVSACRFNTCEHRCRPVGGATGRGCQEALRGGCTAHDHPLDR